MHAPTAGLVNETEHLVETQSVEWLEPEMEDVPKKQAWRRLEEIEDDRRLRDELADWDDFLVER